MCLWQAALCCQHPVPELFFLNSSPRKSLERAILKCVGVHLFPAQGPLVTLPLPETAQDTKPKVLNLHFRPYDLAIAIQVPPLNFWFPQHEACAPAKPVIQFLLNPQDPNQIPPPL